MWHPREPDREEGLLSLDFVIGFSIFMIGLIFVAIMISGLLVHLQGRTIDYDAVAYRTSVVLVEDPGEPGNWQLSNLTFPAERASVRRLGLAIEKNYPGILLLDKVDKFFTSEQNCLVEGTFCSPEDYRKKLIFGDYPYQFNISLKNLDSPLDPPLYVGDPVPSNARYGFIKRIVKIQKPDSVHIFNATADNESVINTTTFRFDIGELSAVPPPYRIDPLNQEVHIIIQNISPQNITGVWPAITDVSICTYPVAMAGGGCIGSDAYSDSPRMNVTIDGTIPYNPGDMITDTVEKNVSVILEKGYFTRIGYDRFGVIDLIIVFDQNVTNEAVYNYNYTTLASLPSPSLPELETAVLEVRIW